MGTVALLAAACGGKVVVDAASSGGQGGDTTSTASVSPVGVVSAVSASTGGTSLCQQICDALTVSGCVVDPDCVEGCEGAYAAAGGCVGLLDAYSQCLLNNVGVGCEGPLQCQDEGQSFADCVGVPTITCGDIACAGNPGGECTCKGVCADRVLAVTCTPGDATDFCTCFEDGMPIGKCAEPQQTGLSCDVASGCCSTVFFP